MFCTNTRSCARADDAKVVHSRDAQCTLFSSFPLLSIKNNFIRAVIKKTKLHKNNRNLCLRDLKY